MSRIHRNGRRANSWRARRRALRTRASIGVSLLAAMAAVVPTTVAPVPPGVTLATDSTALLLCGTTCPTWYEDGVAAVMDNFVTPTHQGQVITPVAVATPGESWPLTGIFRVLGLLLGDSAIFGPGGPAWPDEPWWKLTGLFDLTGDQSIEAGAADLETAMSAHADDSLVIYGLSQGAAVALTVKKRLAKQYPDGFPAPDIDFVFQGDVNVPNGGFHARFPGLYIPILDWTFGGPEPTDTQFDTVVVSTQYDGFADFPLYPLNLIADVNAILGILYLHTRPFDVSLPPDPTTSPAYRGTHGDSSYYFFETQDLPLFAPLRMLGVPEPLIDVVEPFFRVIVEMGYDRSIPLWEPTPARLFPTLDPATVLADLGDAIGQGVDNALALVGLPPISNSQGPVEAKLLPEIVDAEDVSVSVPSGEFSPDSSENELIEPADAIDEGDGVEVNTVDAEEAGTAADEARISAGFEASAGDAGESVEEETHPQQARRPATGVTTSERVPSPAPTTKASRDADGS